MRAHWNGGESSHAAGQIDLFHLKADGKDSRPFQRSAVVVMVVVPVVVEVL